MALPNTVTQSAGPIGGGRSPLDEHHSHVEQTCIAGGRPPDSGVSAAIAGLAETHYSVRSVSTGSARTAAAPGTQQAKTATTESNATAAA